MDIKHQEETDAAAEKWLKKTKALHELYLTNKLGKRPKSNSFEYIGWRNKAGECAMKIEIINTDANQLNLQIK